MSKLDRELKAIMDEAYESGEKMLKAFLPKMFDDDLDEEQLGQELLKLVAESKPKTYDDYIRDIKTVFINDGWIAPTNTTPNIKGGE